MQCFAPMWQSNAYTVIYLFPLTMRKFEEFHAYILFVSALPIDRSRCGDLNIEAQSSEVIISSSTLKQACPSLRKLTLNADQGQRLNITLWNFNVGSSFGHLHDVISGNMAELRSDVRHEHVMMSVGNKVEVNLNSMTSESNFLIEIKGTPNSCPNFKNTSSFQCYNFTRLL